tara:strand:- start:1419 stop:2108 length:690 start_codon:yes stop_codon:yes gene_type:complete
VRLTANLFFFIAITAIWLFYALTTAQVRATEAPKTLEWEDLIPNKELLQNPLAHLTDEQQIEMDILAAMRKRIERGELSPVASRYEESIELTDRLLREGVAVEILLEQYEQVMQEVERRNAELNRDLDGHLVKIPGYALPLEMVGTLVKDFLLVPYLGACIHVPPPPINQMVMVKLQKPYQTKELYEPVWISGKLHAKRSQSNLFYVDGSSNIESGYVLDATSIQPYAQ